MKRTTAQRLLVATGILALLSGGSCFFGSAGFYELILLGFLGFIITVVLGIAGLICLAFSRRDS